MRPLVLLAPYAAAVMCAAGPEAGGHVIDLAVERAVEQQWEVVDPSTVFRAGDQIRFRFRSASAGFLYVLNETSQGDYLWLFPSDEAGTDNRIETGREYVIPSTEGSFRIPPTPGYDIIYWIVTPKLPASTAARPRRARPPRSPNTLTPRCKEGPLRARGVCVDEEAGARAVEDQARLPGWLLPGPAAAPPVIARSEGGARIVAPSGGLVVYEFRVAHR